jgi:ribonuclease HI
MAHDSLGDSTSYVIHNFMTKALSNAVQLRLDTTTLMTDVVYLVHAISQILNIDILRVKGVDSYIIKNQTWTKNKLSKNQLHYRNLIVVSPSLIEDTPIPLELVK